MLPNVHSKSHDAARVPFLEYSLLVAAMKSWIVSVSLTSICVVVQAQFIQWNIEHRQIHRGLTRRSKSTFEEVIKNNAEPLGLVRAFADLQEHNSAKERTILSVDTGSLWSRTVYDYYGLRIPWRCGALLVLETRRTTYDEEGCLHASGLLLHLPQ